MDWNWLSEDTLILPHGWTPETGFLPYRWDNYSEMMMMYLLGLGSSTYPLPPEAWDAWKRTIFEYDGIRYIGSFAPSSSTSIRRPGLISAASGTSTPTIFRIRLSPPTSTAASAWTLARQFPDYSDDLWGITASDSVHGYVVWGGPPETGPIDGTVVPAPRPARCRSCRRTSMRVLRTIQDRYGGGPGAATDSWTPSIH